MRHVTKEQPGFALVALLITIFFVAAAGIVTAQLALSNLLLASVEYYRVNTQFAADAGLDDAIQHLNTDQTYTGTGTETTFYTATGNAFKTTYQTTISDDPAGDTYTKYLDVDAKAYAPATATSPRIERKFQIKLRGVSGGSFSVVTGVGGLYMSNNAKIVGGNVYVNGEIQLTNSAQIGLTTNPVTVRAADQICPVPATSAYPLVCGSGENGEPISMSVNAKIYGDVQATNQTTGTNMFSPGLQSGSPAPQALPTHDRDALKSAITSTITGASAGCSSGTKTWAADTKITGNVSISGSCKVTVNGDIWITGDLSLSNTAQLIVANGLTTAPVLMLDGSSGLSMANSTVLASNTNATPVGFRVVTYWSAASCSPDCSDVTGTDLYNSRNTSTISLSNSSSGPQTEFYARWSRVTINNSGNVGALVGQTVQLSNSGTITFGSSVSGGFGISAWVVSTYKRTY